MYIAHCSLLGVARVLAVCGGGLPFSDALDTGEGPRAVSGVPRRAATDGSREGDRVVALGGTTAVARISAALSRTALPSLMAVPATRASCTPTRMLRTPCERPVATYARSKHAQGYIGDEHPQEGRSHACI